MVSKASARPLVDEATTRQLLDVDGVAGCGYSVDGKGSLRVFLLKDTLEVRTAVLKVIAQTSCPVDKVIFEEANEFTAFVTFFN